jgi:HTH-type transcriptional regulator, competence development regulator
MPTYLRLSGGLRKPPHPEILKRLAQVYEVPHQELLIAAGYLEDQADKGVTRMKVENAYKHVLGDPRFRQGARLKGSTISLEAKRFIVDMYQKLTGQNLLGEG